MSHARLAVLALLLSSPALAQQKGPVEAVQEWWQNITKPPPPPPEKPRAMNSITINPLALQYQRLGIEYERALAKWMSLYAAPQVAYGSAGQTFLLSTGLTLGARFFLLGDAPSGLFFGPEATGSYDRTNQGGRLRYGWGVGLGATVGWTIVFFDRFTLGVGFSAQYRSYPDLSVPDVEVVKVEFSPLPRLAFGVAF